MLNFIYLIIFILVLLIISFLVFLSVFHLKIYFNNRKYQALKEKWQPVLFGYLNNEISLNEATASFNKNYKYTWKFIRTYLDNLDGKDFEKLKNLLQASGFIQYYLKKLRTGSNKDKLKAALILGKVRHKKALPYLEEMLKSDSSLKIKTAGQAISQIGETSLVYEIIKAFLTRTEITYEGISQILILYGQKICPRLLLIIEDWLDGEVDIRKEFQTSPYETIALFVELLGHNKYKGALPVLERLLKEVDNDELIIQIFKALSRIKEPVDLDLTPFINHDNWVVRSQTVRYLYKNWESSYSEQLKARISDENWWVSFYSGMALYHNSFKAFLEEVAVSDKPGSEISNYILEAGGQFEHF
ncbi:HEAT repeat domain-containing protein [Halanaerobiaceae bacterium Z-7014]|uniref:HEAT repeat domain-containing protein n=1 Tax=Halonatronomonas betaini TaxID=2778430 RepID=A0A931F6U8_9FIRM|nr:HEAT repeat domain-containing protein [Halonatronomonas betaini]MBF8437305.1 HEAT repeat domain-containing protein [Halonatronomonas betaini]